MTLPIDGTLLPHRLTQPRYPSDDDQIEIPAVRAEIGRKNNLPSLPSRSQLPSVTGAPPYRPFPQQKQTRQLPEPSTPGQEPGREPLSPEINGGLAPPETKGAPHSPAQSTQAANQTGQQVLHDHDYARSPSAWADHTYFKPLPARPPPGFEHYQPEGRPKRAVKFPSKFDDFDTS